MATTNIYYTSTNRVEVPISETPCTAAGWDGSHGTVGWGSGVAPPVREISHKIETSAHMTYNVFGGTSNLTQLQPPSVDAFCRIQKQRSWHH